MIMCDNMSITRLRMQNEHNKKNKVNRLVLQCFQSKIEWAVVYTEPIKTWSLAKVNPPECNCMKLSNKDKFICPHVQAVRSFFSAHSNRFLDWESERPIWIEQEIFYLLHPWLFAQTITKTMLHMIRTLDAHNHNKTMPMPLSCLPTLCRTKSYILTITKAP